MRAFTETNAAQATNTSYLLAGFLLLSAGIAVHILPPAIGQKEIQTSTVQGLSLLLIILGGVTLYYSRSLRLQIRQGVLEYRDGLRQSHFCRLTDIKNITPRCSAERGKLTKYLELYYQEGKHDYYLQIPNHFENKFLVALQELRPPTPNPKPQKSNTYFRPLKGGSYHAEFGSYLPGFTLLVVIIIASLAFSPWALLLVLGLLPFFTALGSYRLEIHGEKITFSSHGQKYTINQRDITDCQFREPEHSYSLIYGLLSVLTGARITSPKHYDLVNNNQDIYRIPEGIFPDACYIELLTFNKSRG